MSSVCSTSARAAPVCSTTRRSGLLHCTRSPLTRVITCRAEPSQQPAEPARPAGKQGASISNGGSARRRDLFALTALLAAGAAVSAGVPEARAANLNAALEKKFGKEAAQRILTRQGEVSFSDEEWKQRLGDGPYRVLRHEATERPFSSPLNDEKRPGTFVCAGCSSPLYFTSQKFDSGTGWPSFFDVIPGAVMEVPDYSIPFMARTEIRCSKCQGHVGHVFEDGPRPTGLRYCMNGAAMKFQPDA